MQIAFTVDLHRGNSRSSDVTSHCERGLGLTHNHVWGGGALSPSGLADWTGDRVVLGSNSSSATLHRNFGNSVYHEKDNALNHSCVSAMMGCLEYIYITKN